MAYRGGGGRGPGDGEQHPAYSGRRASNGGRRGGRAQPTVFVCLPPGPCAPRRLYNNPTTTGQHGVDCCPPAPMPSPSSAAVRAPRPSPAASPLHPALVSAPPPAPPTPPRPTVSISKEIGRKLINNENALAQPSAAATASLVGLPESEKTPEVCLAPVTIRTPSPSPSTPSPRPSPAASPFQPARVSAPPPAPPTPAPPTASIGEELERISETALAPSAAAAAAVPSLVGQPESEKAAEVDLASVSNAGTMVRANPFRLNIGDNMFHYDIAAGTLGVKLLIYDGTIRFESEQFSATLVGLEKKDKERAERECKITISIAGRTDLYHLQQFLCGTQRDMPQETIQVLDVVLSESPSWNYVTVPRSFFSTTFGHRGDIDEGLECWRGYYQSLRPTQMGLFLNRDIQVTSFFKPVTVIQFVQEFLNLQPLNDRDRVKIKEALRGVCVEANHPEDQIRIYKITGQTIIPMSQLILPVDGRGRESRIPVVENLKQIYEYRLEHTNWPCLQSGSNPQPLYLPMEACKIEEGQRYSKMLSDKQVTNILRATCQRPQQSEQSIREVVASMDGLQISNCSGFLSAQPHRQDIIEDLCNVIKVPERVSVLNSLEENASQPKIVKETFSEEFQVLIYVLDFDTITLMVQKTWSIQRMVSEAYLKCGGIYFHPRVIINNKIEAGLDDTISDFVRIYNVRITSRLLGGARIYLDREVALSDYLYNERKTLFDVCTLPSTVHFPHMHPYFVSLGPPLIQIARQLLGLVLNNCFSPFGAYSLLYNAAENKLSFAADVVVIPFTQILHYQNLSAVGTIFSEIFLFDENMLLSSASSIHVTGPTPAKSWRLPPFVDLLVFDLQTTVRRFLPFNRSKNKSYFETHVGHMTPPQRVKYLLCQELDTEYKGGENYLETVVGLVSGCQSGQATSSKSDIRSWEGTARMAPLFIKMLPPKKAPTQSSHNHPPNPRSRVRKNKKAATNKRTYNFWRIGALWSCGRNFVGHGKKIAGCKISLKQAEAYLNLVFTGLTYHVRLRTRFSQALVKEWHIAPNHISQGLYKGPTSVSINADWCQEEFTEEEVLSL